MYCLKFVFGGGSAVNKFVPIFMKLLMDHQLHFVDNLLELYNSSPLVTTCVFCIVRKS